MKEWRGFLLLILFGINLQGQNNFEIHYQISTLNGAHVLLEIQKRYDDYLISHLSTWSIQSILSMGETELQTTLENAVSQDETLPITIDRSNYIKPEKIEFDLFKERSSNTYYRSLPDPGRISENADTYALEPNLIPMVLVRDSLVDLKWTIEDEYRSIDNIRCRKAVMNYRCKDYTAWFDPDTPIPAGPEQFGGLPGLIISMSRTVDGVSWHLKKFQTISGENKEDIQNIKRNIAQTASMDWCEYGLVLESYVNEMTKYFGGPDCKTCETKFTATYLECFEDCGP